MSDTTIEFTEPEFLTTLAKFSKVQVYVTQGFIEMFENVLTAIFISRLLWYTVNSQDVIDNDGWFYHSSNQWEKIGITKNVRQRIQKELLADGFIEMKKIGMPAKNHYRINTSAVFQAIAKQNNLNVVKPDVLSAEIQQSRVLNSRHLEVLNSDDILYNEKVKEKKEYSVLESLNKSSSYNPTKKQIEKILQVPEYRAREIVKNLKSFGDINERKIYLEDVIEGKYKKPKIHNKSPDTVVFSEKEDHGFELIQELYWNNSDFKPVVTDDDRYNYKQSLKKFSVEQIHYVAKYCIKAVNAGQQYYSRSLSNIIKEKTIAEFISVPYLAQLKRENDEYYNNLI